jgi:oligopeptide transport system substrate-binding protein
MTCPALSSTPRVGASPPGSLSGSRSRVGPSPLRSLSGADTRAGYTLLAFVVAACGVPDGQYFGHIPDDIDPHHMRWCNQGEPDYLDPARASSTASSPLVMMLFDGLTTYNRDGLPVASLATSWDISEDLRTYTFHLRRDAKWSNGHGITAYDIAYTAVRVANRLTASPNADNIQTVKNVTPYLAHSIAQLRHDVAPYRAGEIVELLWSPIEAPDLDARASTHVLALRDLGAPETAAYASVPPGIEVSVIERTGQRATPASTGGREWAYVYWQRDAEGVFGWVPASELTVEPHADMRLLVRRVTAKSRPGFVASIEELAADELVPRPPVYVRGRDVTASTDVLGITVPDPYTIVFECSDPTPFFLALTANRALRTTPIETVSRWPNRWTQPDRIVTSGPMHLIEWNDRDHLTFVRSKTYWNQPEIKLDRITVISMDDQAANTNLYFTGGCDAMAANTIPSTYLPALNGELRGRAFKDYSVAPILSVYYALINTKVVTNRHLRRALSFAIDRTPIPLFIHGNEIPSAVMTPGTPIRSLGDADLAACGVTRDTPGIAMVMLTGELCYVPPPGLDYDLARAKQELALARQELGGTLPNLTYRYNTGSEAHKQIAEYLQSSWKAIGLEVRIESQEWNSMLDASRNGKFEVMRFGAQGTLADTEAEFLAIFRCASPDNRGKWCNPEFEALMEEARTMRDRKARNAKVREAESVVLEDAAILPMYVYTQKHLIKPYVRDYPVNLVDQPPLWRTWIDPDWERHR